MNSSWASLLSPNSSRSSSSDTSNVAGTPAAPERVVLVVVDPQAQTIISNGAVTRKLGEAFAQSLDERVTMNAAGDPAGGVPPLRKSGVKRRYVTNRKWETAPSLKVQELVPLCEIVDGSAFKKPRRDSSESDLSRVLDSDRTENREEAGETCFGSRYHQKWDRDTLAKVRSGMPPRGTGQQKARSIFLGSCFTKDEARLHIRSGTDATPLCCSLFRVLMGASFFLLPSQGCLLPWGYEIPEWYATTSRL